MNGPSEEFEGQERRKAMNRVQFLAASAAVVLWFAGPAVSAPKPINEYSSMEARTSFEQIDTWASTVSDDAFQLGAMARSERAPESHLEGLAVLREDINRIGVDLQTLDAKRGSLSEWEVKALNQIMPLMQDVADNAEKAIQTYNSDRQRLWATSYVGDTDTISKDAGEVATLLRNYLNLAKTQQKELQLEHSLAEAQGSLRP
jgi:hypothetical protein